jgi:DNA repair protein Rad10
LNINTLFPFFLSYFNNAPKMSNLWTASRTNSNNNRSPIPVSANSSVPADPTISTPTPSQSLSARIAASGGLSSNRPTTTTTASIRTNYPTSTQSIPTPLTSPSTSPSPSLPLCAATFFKNQPNHLSILVNPRQKGNPLLSRFSHISFEYGDVSYMPADYEISDTICVLYLSAKYHMLYPNYIIHRMKLVLEAVNTATKSQPAIKSLATAFTTRILILQIDVEDSESIILSINNCCFGYGWTLVCSWSSDESARYIETLKLYEKKTSDSLQEKIDETSD